MSVTLPSNVSGSYSLRRRLMMALAVVLVAASYALVTLAQTPTGMVTGVCTDAATGTPLADVPISLSRHTDDDNDNASDMSSGVVQNALGDTSPPAGWKQDSRDDSQYGFGGASTTPRNEFQTHSDAQGRFTLKRVPTGEYDVYYASSSGHHLDKPVSVVVTDNQTATLTLPLVRDKPNLRFINAGHNWTPKESVAVSLNGLLQTRAVQFSIERLDVAGTLARRPADLTHLDAQDSDSENKPSQWPGQFALVRHWTYALTKTDPEGAFTEHVALGALPLGVYRITAQSVEDGQNITAISWALVTRLALVRKTDGDKLLAWVTDIKTGRPQANVSLALYDQTDKTSKLLGQTQTAPDGTAHLTTTGALSESEGALIARQGDSLVALNLDLNSQGDEGSGPSDTADEPQTSGNLRAFIYSDRPVYRPGQTVNLKGIGRWFDAQHGFTIPKNQTVTLDVRDAQNTLVTHQQVTTNDMGSWNATLALSPEALTGEYSVKAQLGTETNDATFNVAAYQKPEYQATVTFTKDRYIHGEAIEATVTATYFYGAPVSGGKAHIYVTRGDADSGEYGGEEPADSGEPLPDEDVKLDGNGQATIRIPTKDQPNAEGDQPYTVSADIEDASQRSVEAKGTTTVAQGLFSLQVTPSARNAKPGTSLTVTIKAAGESGVAQAGQAVELESGYRAYGRDDQETWTRVSDARLTTNAGGEATTTVTAPRTGDLVFRASARDARGNKITAEDDVWVVGAGEDIPSGHLPDLSLTLDRDKYAPGQTARLLINTAHPGPAALVTVEGRALYRTMVVPLTRHATAIDLDVTADDAPSVTVKVCCIRDKRYQESVGQLVVNDQHRDLQISVAADKTSYHPGDPAVIQILTRDTAGRPTAAEVSVGVVDSAIYAIMPESPLTIAEALTPDQGNHVQTDNSCPEIYLGDVDKGATDIDIRRKFPDTALWKPDVRTGPDGRATVHLDMPDTLTTWRVTCVGQTSDTEVGKGVGTMTVAKDLLVRLESPPFLTAGDTQTVAAVVHNNTPATVHATVRLIAGGLRVQDNASQQADVPPGEPVRLTWTVSAPAQAAPATLQVTAQADSRMGPLTDGVEQPLSVIPHGVFQDQWHSGTLLNRVSKDVTLDPNALPGSTTLRVRLAPSVASALLPASDYLASYPYGSTDATVSAFVPAVFLADSASDLLLTDTQRLTMRDKVGRSLLRLARFQNADGGWGWFPTDRGDLYMTAYAAWGLSLARDAGYKINPTVLDGAADQLKSQTSTTHYIPTYDSRYPLAALALAALGKSAESRTVIHSLERAQAAIPEQVTPSDLALGALAAHRLGPTDEGTAQSLMRALWAISRQTGSLSSWTASAHRSQQGVAEDLPDSGATAWALLAALSVTPADPRVDGAARWLMANRRDDHWDAPADTAVAVLALSQYMARSNELQPDFNARLLINGKVIRQLHFGPEALAQPDQVIDLPGTVLNSGVNTLTLEKDGPGRLYYTADLKQCLTQPAPPPAPTLFSRLMTHLRYPHGVPLPPAPSGYRIKRVYLRMTTRRNFLWEDTVPAPDTHLNAGESVLVRLIIQCTRPSSRVVIQEPVPAGCRIAEVAGDNAAEWDHWWNYTDVRDDRLVFFISDLMRGEHEIDYHLQAQTPGAYDVMPTLLTSIVDPTLYALGRHTDRIQIDPKG